MFGRNRREAEQTDVVIMLTPHIIRVLDLSEGDLRAFRVGRDSVAPITELPVPIELPRQEPPATAPTTPGTPPASTTPAAPGGGPILGPTPTPARPR